MCGTEILSQVKYIVINIISANNGGNRWYTVVDVEVPDVSKIFFCLTQNNLINSIPRSEQSIDRSKFFKAFLTCIKYSSQNGYIHFEKIAKGRVSILRRIVNAHALTILDIFRQQFFETF